MPSNPTPEQRLIYRVNALLNKTVENGATPEEAASAAAKAQRLILDYQLSEDDLMKARQAGSGSSAPIVMARVTIATSRGDLKDWRRAVFNAVAATNFCKPYKSGTYNMLATGTQLHLTLVEQIYFSLANQLMAICEEEVVKAKHDGSYAGGSHGQKNSRKWRMNFMNAAGQAVVNLLWKRYRESLKEADLARGVTDKKDPRSALLVVNQHALLLDTYEKEEMGKIGSYSTAAPDPFADASRRGYEAGERVRLDHAISSAPIPKAAPQLKG